MVAMDYLDLLVHSNRDSVLYSAPIRRNRIHLLLHKKKKKIIESIRCGLFSFNIYLVAIAIPIPHSDHVAEASKRYIPKL